jgi:hypothetical protein
MPAPSWTQLIPAKVSTATTVRADSTTKLMALIPQANVDYQFVSEADIFLHPSQILRQEFSASVTQLRNTATSTNLF